MTMATNWSHHVFELTKSTAQCLRRTFCSTWEISWKIELETSTSFSACYCFICSLLTLLNIDIKTGQLRIAFEPFVVGLMRGKFGWPSFESFACQKMKTIETRPKIDAQRMPETVARRHSIFIKLVSIGFEFGKRYLYAYIYNMFAPVEWAWNEWRCINTGNSHSESSNK